ncbi:MAG: Gfo/Idh/MocA family oxidoreductase [Spirochaetota bacterium]|nr:Gfo/Idh/MocA family oxidoreductase [Spirochaetota bacterium]
MEKLRLGIIGVGHMGQYHLNVANSTLKDRFIMTGFYDTNKERAIEISQKYDISNFNNVNDLINNIDAVIIAVPTNLHFKYASMALENGVHTLVEKPVTESIEQAKQLTSLARRKGLIFQVGHVERFNGAVQELHKIVTAPLIIESRRLCPFTDRVKDVGVVLDLMIHDIDIVMNIVKSPVISVMATGGSIYSDFEDYATAVLQFENNCVATVTASRVTQRKIRTLAISQEKSYIYLDYATQDIQMHRQASQAYLLTKEEIKYSQESFVEELFVHKENPLKQELEHFYDCIVREICPIVSNDIDIKILEITLEIESMTRGDMEKDKVMVMN